MVSFIVGHKIKNMIRGSYGDKMIAATMKLDLFKNADFDVDLSHLHAHSLSHLIHHPIR